MSDLSCSNCKAVVNGVFVSPTTGNRYCNDCWERVKTFTPAVKSPTPLETAVALYHYPQGTGVPEDRKLMKHCTACGAWATSGVTIGADWVCSVCVNEDDGKDIHLRMTVRGKTSNREFLHYVIGQLDTDWPFAKATNGGELCKNCGGVVYKNALFSAAEIKKLASACGTGKVKIRYWGEAEKCLVK